MPKKYEKIRDSLLSQGKGKEEAERIAAATYNKQRKPGSTPMGPRYEERVKEGKKVGVKKKKG